MKISDFFNERKDFLESNVNPNHAEKLRIGIDSRNYYNIAISVCWRLILKNMKINASDLKFSGLCDSNTFAQFNVPLNSVY